MPDPANAIKCATCLFFDALTEGGLCRLNPPVAGSSPAWPRVSSQDWCGQHLRKAPKNLQDTISG